MSGHGVVLWREKRMDVALVCAPRSALSGLMTTLCDHTQMPTHTHRHKHTDITIEEERLQGKRGKGGHRLIIAFAF